MCKHLLKLRGHNTFWFFFKCDRCRLCFAYRRNEVELVTHGARAFFSTVRILRLAGNKDDRPRGYLKGGNAYGNTAQIGEEQVVFQGGMWPART